MATNTFLLRFDEFELAEIKRLTTSPQGDPVSVELDYLYKALCDLKTFAKDSLDQNNLLIDEAFAQFEWNSTTSILRRSFAILGFDIYRNLAHIHGAEQSIFAVLSQPLSFFNECIDNLFSWLVRDLRCTIFQEAWDAWLAYKDHCEEFGFDRPGDEPLDRKNKLRTDQLLRKMARAFDDLKYKKLPRISSAPRHFTDVGAEIDHLLVDGSDLLNSDPTISLPICFTKLSEYLNSCIYCKTWGIFGEKLFIQLICTLKGKNKFDISPEESNRLDSLWIETRSSFINFLDRLKTVTNSNILSEFYEWLNEHKYLALPSQKNCSRRQLNACILKELPVWCRNLILDICEEALLDLVRDAYDGIVSAWFDRFDMPDVMAQGRELVSTQMPVIKKETPTEDIGELKDHITAAKEEIIAKCSKDKRGPGRPSKTDKPSQVRGPKNTRMMKVERKEVITYLEIECHRTVDSCTPTDCLHVWNLPENKPSFDYAAKQRDATRGYTDYTALYAGILYYREQEILRSQRKKSGLFTK